MRVACVSRGVECRRSTGQEAETDERAGLSGTSPGPAPITWITARWRAALVAIAAMLVMAPGPQAGAVVGGTPVPAGNHQLDAVGLFITDQPWAPCGGWISGTCTLVGDNLVLLARHSVENAQRQLPADGARSHKVRFRRAVDGSVNNHYGSGPSADCAGGFQEIYVRRFFGNPWPGIDMVLGELEHAPLGIVPLPLQVSHTTTAAEPIVLAGWGYDGACLATGEAWTLRSRAGVLPAQTYGSWCCFEYNGASFTGVNCFVTPTGSTWVIGNLHDSGAPLLSPDPQDASVLRVVGMVTSVTSAQKLSAWNDGGGEPVLADSAPRRCLSDLDGDGRITVSDLLEYVQRYLGGDASVDVDGVPGLTLNDLFTFLSRFFSGC